MKQFVTVGRVKDAHGLKGELFITLKAGEASWLKRLKTLRLVPPTSGEPKTYPIKSARVHKNGMIVLSPEITDRNQAEALKGWSFEIPSEFLVSNPGEEIYLIEIQGFRVNVIGKGDVGVIVGFSSNGAQDLIIVKTETGEFDIPLVRQFVKKIDYKAQIVEMELPVGLLGEDIGDEPEPESESEVDDE